MNGLIRFRLLVLGREFQHLAASACPGIPYPPSENSREEFLREINLKEEGNRIQKLVSSLKSDLKENNYDITTLLLLMAASIRSSSASPTTAGEMEPEESDQIRQRNLSTVLKSPFAANSRIMERKRCGFGFMFRFVPVSLMISPNTHRASEKAGKTFA